MLAHLERLQGPDASLEVMFIDFGWFFWFVGVFFLRRLSDFCIGFHRCFVIYFARLFVFSGSLNEYLSNIKDPSAIYKLLQWRLRAMKLWLGRPNKGSMDGWMDGVVVIRSIDRWMVLFGRFPVDLSRFATLFIRPFFWYPPEASLLQFWLLLGPQLTTKWG